jgi:hypothetical protein
MDPVQCDTMFAGLSDQEMFEAITRELARRDLIGCVFAFPEAGGQARFSSCTPADTISDYSASRQLAVFSEVAALAIAEVQHVVVDDEDTSFNPKEWIN